MLDPFTRVHSAILSALQDGADFSALVKPGNLLDVTSSDFEQFKSALQPADTPEVVLLPDDFHLQPFGISSRIASISQDYQLVATHDSMRTTTVNGLKFAAMTALLAAGTDLGLAGLVRTWEITTGHDDLNSNNSWRRGAKRWITLMTIRVQMDLDRSMLLAQE